MTEFKSPAFKRSVGAKPYREFSPVGAPEDTTNPLPPVNPSFLPQNAPPNNFSQFSTQQPTQLSQEEMELLRQAREQKNNPIITPPAKKRIEYLADLGRMTKDVQIGEHIFQLRTLKSKEIKEVYTTVAHTATNAIEEPFIYRRFSLAYALYKIDNSTLDLMLDIKTFPERLEFIDGLEENIASQLFTAYEKLRQESNNQFAVKTEQDAKEVADALKK